MSIIFNTDRLSTLYQFKQDTIDLCLTFMKDVIKNSSYAKAKISTKFKEIETDLYDIFCRWNFNAIYNDEFDINLFLPTGMFVMMVDLSYYLRRFNINLIDSLIEFPMDKFNKIRQNAINNIDKKEQLNTIKCSEVQEHRLHNVYKGNTYDTDRVNLLSRYYYLGGLNNSLSIPPRILAMFKSHELFGTPFNTCSDTYCSPFDDERCFGSSGSFFKFTEYNDESVYFANPPFDDFFCNNMSDKLIEELDKRLFSLIVIIPVWDNTQQEKYNLKNFGLPFDCYNKLVQSKYFIQEEFLHKNSYPFFNYFYNKYVYISNIHMINLGRHIDLKKIKQIWQTLKNEKKYI